MSQNQEKVYWRCQVCGYEVKDYQPPDKCPKCQVSKEKFILRSEYYTQISQ